jgi:hypothetical protein
LEKLGGVQPDSQKPGNATAPSPSVPGTAPSTASSTAPSSERASSLPFPTIKNLPLLGAKYADYYRRAKIQETVYELLTEQYELAKVEEAKETPSVKVLDPGRVPERKSFPPRALIIFLGTFVAAAGSLVYVLGARSWEETDPKDPRKLLAQEVVATLRASNPWASRNGHESTPEVEEFGSRISNHRTTVNGDAEK